MTGHERRVENISRTFTARPGTQTAAQTEHAPRAKEGRGREERGRKRGTGKSTSGTVPEGEGSWPAVDWDTHAHTQTDEGRGSAMRADVMRREVASV